VATPHPKVFCAMHRPAELAAVEALEDLRGARRTRRGGPRAIASTGAGVRPRGERSRCRQSRCGAVMPKSSATSRGLSERRLPDWHVRVPFVRPSLPPVSALADSYAAIIQSRMLTKGPFLDRFERALADHLGVRHAVAVSSCTVGLMLAYKALDIAAGRCEACAGDRPACPLVLAEPLGRFGMARAGGRSEPVGEVVMPSFTFLAAAGGGRLEQPPAGLRRCRSGFDQRHARSPSPPPSRRARSPSPPVTTSATPAMCPALEAIAAEHGAAARDRCGPRLRGEIAGAPVGSGSDGAGVQPLSHEAARCRGGGHRRHRLRLCSRRLRPDGSGVWQRRRLRRRHSRA
jgi:hypothetical protein